MRVALAQINPTVGDVAGNTALVLDAIERAKADDADLLVCPEMSLLGYPPRDLLQREGVVERCEAAVAEVAAAARGITVIVGHPRRATDGVRRRRNSASVCADGVVTAVHDKRLLPGYDIFDEDRYFDAGEGSCLVDLARGTGEPGAPGLRAGVLICEDLWRAGDVVADPRYAADPAADLVAGGATVLVALNASPFILGKFDRHVELVRETARRLGVPIVTVNQVGAHDDVLFDGRSLVIDADGAVRAILPGWTQAVETVDLADGAPITLTPADPNDDLFRALTMGVRDYCRKTGHRKTLIGLSGGIDSALTATIAAAALGPENVTGVMMPSRYSSPGSLHDAEALAEQLGLDSCPTVGIEEAHRLIRRTVGPALADGLSGLADENLQARLRGLILMSISNTTGALVLATSNKSELAVGYSTLYGDMCGAISVIGDLVKSRVYTLARWINENAAACGWSAPPIPEASITKPPSAELRPDQKDQDTLPPYDVLDEIIERIVDREQSVDRIVRETGFDPALVRDVMTQIDRAEYKRHQATIILKVTQRAFGRGRNMPLAAGGSPGQADGPEPRFGYPAASAAPSSLRGRSDSGPAPGAGSDSPCAPSGGGSR